MTKTGKYFSFLISFLFLMNQAIAAITVQSRVDRTEMGLGDTVTLTVSVNSDKSVDVSEPRVPSLEGFDLVNSWSSQGRSTKLIQGTAGMEFQTMSNYDYNFMITPQKKGRLSVPAFELVVDGKTYYTQPIVITVSEEGSGAGLPPPGMPAQPSILDEEEEIFNQLLRRGGAMPGQQGGGAGGGQGGNLNRGMNSPSVRTLPKNMNEAFFIQVEVDKTDVYEGEQVLVNWYIYTRGNLLSLDRLKFPDLKGFWKEIIEEVPALNFTEEFINNVRYKKALLASHALFPIKPGTAIIDEYKIKSTAQLPTSPYGAFGFGPPYTYTKTSERVKINVKPLPVEGRPSDFAGAVGNFEVRAQVENSSQQNQGAFTGQAGQFPVNQPFALKIRFEGTGNAKLIELPPLNLPANLELYDTKSESKFFRNGKSYKEFEVLVIPREQGDVTIPSISFSQFDPTSKKYATKKTTPISLKIIAGSGASSLADNRVQTSGAPPPAVIKKNELPPILVSYEAKSALPKMYSWIFWFSLYSVITLILLLKLRSELGFGKRKKDLSEIMNRRLKKVDSLIEKQDWRAVGVEMTNVIYQILGDVSGQGGASLEITALLDKAPPSLRREIGTELAQCIEIFQIMSFAPENIVGALKDKAEMKKNVSKAAKILSRGIDLAEDRQGFEDLSKQMS